ncbi:hypothetical protein E7744_07655 [Citricoccus sp. SGAir0253]|uniref:MaoC/PaaZ C-terminal domain-containing protein n=1 Tax=Citricoccus sp. SGAir0253 TaxID=2567881 RepID=UPI0010CD2CE9|nr:MaoC/PaaZ C-terminal domain-containing protein [Citricoccus sp. SGAir0253]QCU78072.1 hypothetical protein E7744_07655 [Citricoccus sp. SGAir0253]
MPSLAAGYRAALSAAAGDAVLRRRRPQRLPARTVVVRDHVIGEDLVRSHAALYPHTGRSSRGDLPSVLVHVAAFPAAMALVSAPDFPLPLLGLVHLRNRVHHRRPVPAGVPLQVAATATGLAPHPAGTAVDLVVTVHGPDGPGAPAAEPLWEGTSTYLARGVRLDGHERPERPARPGFEAPPLTARWRLPAATGRRYAALSGDYNPIHLNPLAARALGQPGMIAHGMYLAGRMLAGREPAGAGHRWEIDFATPVRLPGTVDVSVRHPADGLTEVTAWDPRRLRPHFTGRIALPGPRDGQSAA